MARRPAPDHVIAKLRQGKKMIHDGRPMIVVKELQVTEAAWYRSLKQFGGDRAGRVLETD